MVSSDISPCKTAGSDVSLCKSRSSKDQLTIPRSRSMFPSSVEGVPLFAGRHIRDGCKVSLPNHFTLVCTTMTKLWFEKVLNYFLNTSWKLISPWREQCFFCTNKINQTSFIFAFIIYQVGLFVAISPVVLHLNLQLSQVIILKIAFTDKCEE